MKYKFRGFCEFAKRWVYGSYTEYEGEPYIYNLDSNSNEFYYKVAPESVGMEWINGI